MTASMPAAVRHVELDPAGGPGRQPGFAQAALVPAGSRILFLSGQAPVDADGHTPATFEEQARLAWSNLVAVLAAADLTVANLVKVSVYLRDRGDRAAFGRVRREFLGDLRPTVMAVVTELWVDTWMLEIEAVAAG